MMAAQAILDRGYGKPVQSVDANITEDGGPIRYYAEVPKKAQSAEAWLQSLASGGEGESAQAGTPRSRKCRTQSPTPHGRTDGRKIC
jgi:hypothetical protein